MRPRFGGLRGPSARSKSIACASCGEAVLKRRRRYCEACLPQARRERGLRAIEAARKALAAQAAAGKDPRASAHAGRMRGEANAEHHRRNNRWAREHPGQRDRAWFERKVAPKLQGYPLSAIARGRGYRSRPAHESGQGRRCLIRGIGHHCRGFRLRTGPLKARRQERRRDLHAGEGRSECWTGYATVRRLAMLP